MAIPHELSSPQTWVDNHGDYLYTMALYRVRDETLSPVFRGKDQIGGDI